MPTVVLGTALVDAKGASNPVYPTHPIRTSSDSGISVTDTGNELCCVMSRPGTYCLFAKRYEAEYFLRLRKEPKIRSVVVGS